jgi:hypothetical protein
MKQIIIDILKPNGKWSFKRMTALYILNMAIIYAFLPIVKSNFDVKEFVFVSLLGYSATMVGVTAWEKLKVKKDNNE